MKGIVLCLMFVTLFLVAGGCHRGTDGKQGLKVLYVGFNPDRELPPRNFTHGAGIAESRYEKDMRERMPAFEKLLKQYFVKVQTVDARDYEESMTEEFDVIVFDGVPEPVYPKQEEVETELAPVAKKLQTWWTRKLCLLHIIFRISIVNRLCLLVIKQEF